VTIVCKNSVAVTDEVKGLELNVSPNPTMSSFTIQWQGNSNDEVLVEVYNVLGARIMSIKSSGSNSIQFGNELIAGIYLVKVTQRSEEKTIKAIKQN
jgi:hypothetical protein